MASSRDIDRQIAEVIKATRLAIKALQETADRLGVLSDEREALDREREGRNGDAT